MFEDGMIIMIIGMGIVFSFLTIMVFAMMAMTPILKLLGKFLPEAEVEIKTPTKKSKRTKNNNEEIAIAIAATKALS